MQNSLQLAYAEALYIVFVEGQEQQLTVGKRVFWLDDMLLDEGVEAAAFITAYNPQSKILTETINQLNQQKLIAQIEDLGWVYFKGLSCDHKKQWPKEEGLLVLGIGLEECRRISHTFNQAAFLWMERECEVKLIFLSE